MSRTVVVTGASAGVGRAAAVAFASRGDRVGLLARVQTDVADADAVEQAAAAVEERIGPIDVWVDNAMATVFARLHEITAEEFRRSTEVTYLGTVHGTMLQSPSCGASTPSRGSPRPCAASSCTSAAPCT
ncbi:MAG TPA: SDR family NAD(P)-dependent oxidoreductase [Gaiellales bacterium]|jgi:NAD(P)-dependent dehydrogenase (short-subunit alcohol dehydrogenase family)|nr:SDR family NAD(P)-dependent oxidoreductase [Gaiellales bacterium]